MDSLKTFWQDTGQRFYLFEKKKCCNITICLPGYMSCIQNVYGTYARSRTISTL